LCFKIHLSAVPKVVVVPATFASNSCMSILLSTLLKVSERDHFCFVACESPCRSFRRILSWTNSCFSSCIFLPMLALKLSIRGHNSPFLSIAWACTILYPNLSLICHKFTILVGLELMRIRLLGYNSSHAFLVSGLNSNIAGSCGYMYSFCV